MTHIYDVAIIGAGINGAGIARDCALRGLSVYICDKGDIGGETSANSTKLIHGGLRYLEFYEFSLVRKALQERERLIKIAPNLISPLTFTLPYNKNLRPYWLIKAGLKLYDVLAFPSKHFPLSKPIKASKNNTLSNLSNHFKKGFTYSDGWVDDHRLVIYNAKDAQTHGTTVEPMSQCTNISKEDKLWHLTLKSGKKTKVIKAKTVVNAAGPWAEELIHNALSTLPPYTLKLVKGSHIVVPQLFEHNSAYIFQQPDGRIVFAIPYQNSFTLIGTTEETVKSAEKPKCSKAEEAYLLTTVNNHFKKQISPKDVIWRYAGIRPLIEDTKVNSTQTSRDYIIHSPNEDDSIIHIFGGKITTYRTLAKSVTDRITKHLGIHKNCLTSKHRLHTAIPPVEETQKLQHKFNKVEKQLITRLVHAYGVDAVNILSASQGIYFGHTLYQAEVDYLIENEWATTAEQILFKRTKLGLHFSEEEVKELERYIASSIKTR